MAKGWLEARSLDAHDAAGDSFGDARDQIFVGRDEQAGFGVAEMHARARVRGGVKMAVNGDVAAGHCSWRRNAVDSWYAVRFQSRQPVVRR
jgi:hypothetical protein